MPVAANLFISLDYEKLCEMLARKRAMLDKLHAFAKDQSGATAIEYGLIAAGIAVAIISVVKGVGTKLNTTFSSISTQLK